MKLKRGDKVLVQKPENIHESPVWVFAMDKFDGKIMTVSSAGEDRVRLEGAGSYTFNTKWLVPLDSPEYVDLGKFSYDMNDLM